jgi:broad specificity phosphatase PhoE
MNLTIVRHGQTEENKEGIIQGQNDGTLSSLGVKQSNKVAVRLAIEKFNVIFSSDLGRCTHTAARIRHHHPATPLILSSKLREIAYGAYQGRPIDDLDSSNLAGTILTQKVSGGESWTDLSHRIATFLNDIYAEYKDSDVLLVTHGGPIQVIRAYLEPGLLIEFAKEPSIPNCGIRRLTMAGTVSLLSVKGD